MRVALLLLSALAVALSGCNHSDDGGGGGSPYAEDGVPRDCPVCQSEDSPPVLKPAPSSPQPSDP